jgi:hypothetical protein
MAARLRGLGFEVVERTNLTTRQIGATLREFRNKLASAAVGLVFYAGHGMQIRGENYLPAVDAEIASEEEVPNQSLALRQILDVLDAAKTRLNLVFLDACRDNPLARTLRSGASGLAKVEAPSGTLISYATRPGSVARDGTGRNGLFTSQLLRQMTDATDAPIEQVLKRVLAGVKKGSGGQQEPWWEGSLEGDFCFGRCASGSPALADTNTNAIAAAASATPGPPSRGPAPQSPAPSPQASAAAGKATAAPPGRLALARPAASGAVGAAVAAAADQPRGIQVSLPGLEPLYFTRAFSRNDTGRIYRLVGSQASEQHVRLPEGNRSIFSVAQSPSGKLYFCDATESRIFEVRADREVVVYQHTGFVKHLAFDPAGRLYFSSVSGSGDDGLIYRLDGSVATLIQAVKLAEVGGNWSGTFAFDRQGVLWLSSGSRPPASLYRVRDNRPEKVFTAPGSGIMGFSFLADGSIAYADNKHSVMRLTLPDLRLSRVFESPYEGWLTDVKPAHIVAQP